MIVEQEKQVLLKQMLEVQMWGSCQRLKMWKELCKNVILICLLEQTLLSVFCAGTEAVGVGSFDKVDAPLASNDFFGW